VPTLEPYRAFGIGAFEVHTAVAELSAENQNAAARHTTTSAENAIFLRFIFHLFLKGLYRESLSACI
jgi:hypothetical protein